MKLYFFHKIIFFVLMLTFSFMMSCERPAEIDIDQVIEEKVQDRLRNFKTVLDRNCMEKVYEDAGKIADSIILEYARQKRDTSQRPPRPIRPEQPELKVLEDTLHLAPLFDTIQ